MERQAGANVAVSSLQSAGWAGRGHSQARFLYCSLKVEFLLRETSLFALKSLN